jgi:hypothetical protein
VLKLCLALALVVPARLALACGVTAGGAPGITACSLEEHDEAVRRRWHVASSYAFSSTALRFSDHSRLDEERHVSLVTLDYRPARRATLSAGAGAFLGGSLTTAGGARQDFSPGVVAVLGGAWRIWDPERAGPFALLTGQLSYASTRAAAMAYNALDLRAGVVVGTTLARIVTPYAAARAFGGPVFWGSELTGTDTHHYQVAAGVAVLLWRRVDLFAEGVPLGERGIAVGVGLAL